FPAPGTYLTDTQAMALALDAARQGLRGANPLVGAVILSAENQLLHIGWHKGAGTSHAEAHAIAQAKETGTPLEGARMFVTLEPCNHTGRTGPCSHAVAGSGISQLTYAYADTTENAAGGAAYLRSRGVKVQSGLLAEQSFELNARWFAAAHQNRPWVTAKIASSADGFIAAQDGSSQWITGEAARADGHALRTRVAAIMVGNQTVFVDNPHLTARIQGKLAEKQPLRVVMGLRQLSAGSYLAGEVAAGRAVHLATRNPQAALEELYARGIRHLLLEGGPTLITAFMRDNLVDDLLWYRAPLMLGAGRRALGDLGIGSLNAAQHWALDDLGAQPALRVLGADTATHLIATSTSEHFSPQGAAAPTER
ncbi:MAG: bifunctional diaminohydroxyphosphoribosylaminopyrimidine deaminase/5-amino-6-(5-phosphoribosylamino)uracil reductase RibD, partial [Rothia sp. (in: high G+C Gram-positive bacteria)]|nr:bifunctional diaminohydroxyphosphoribosylaminopyrimidine deaminase/5-amino-6-(5-phosphoribosylamino)uracil reductase RibD [Rothia sp. (in: high G+C Gram-positive bacteria)]